MYRQLKTQVKKHRKFRVTTNVHSVLHNLLLESQFLSTHYTPCLKKTVQICFCYNFVKFPPIWIIFGRKMAKRLKLYQMNSFFISPNSRHHTTVLNADLQNCYITLKVVICNSLSDDLISKNKQKCGLFS